MNSIENASGDKTVTGAGGRSRISRSGGWNRGMLAGLWFGVVCGLLEGIVQLAAQTLIDTKYVSVHILWVAPCLYGVAFALAGGAIGLLAGRILPRASGAVLLLLLIFMTILVPLSILLQDLAAVYAILVLALGLSLVVWRPLLQRQDRVFAFLGRTAGWLAGLAVIAALLVPQAVQLRESLTVRALPEATPGAPNMIVLVIDTLRADHLSLQGYQRKTSPYLDELAQQGVYFERAYSTSPWTLPSHISLVTGTSYDRHRIGWYNGQALRSYKGDVLPEVLMQHGYRTGAFSANVFFVTHDRLGRGFVHFDDYFFSFKDAVLRTIYGRAFEKYILQRLGLEDIPARRFAGDINQAFMDWAVADPGRPFFALLNYIDLHDPYLPREPYRSMFSSAGALSGKLNARVGRDDPELDDAQLASEVDAYDGGIVYVDEQIHALVNWLESQGLASNTILVVTSDHGESFGEHGLFLHGHSLYHEQLHVPLLFVWPGHVPAQLSLDYPVTNASIAATLLDLCGVENAMLEAAPSLAGWSPESAARSPVVAHTEKVEWAVERSPAYTGNLSSVFRDEWQLILHSVNPPGLYNLADDPAQLNNLSGQAASQAVENELARLLNKPL